MMTAQLVVACALALMPQSAGRASKPASPATRPATAASAVASVSGVDRALFHIRTDDGSGSGFQYRTAGYVLTNRHVVHAAPVGATVNLRPVRTSEDGSVGLGEPITGTVRFKHPELDVAVIEIPPSRDTSCLMPITTAGGKHVARGVELYAHGFPATTGPVVTPTISRGLLSAHYADPVTGQTLYLTDTALSPGSSGGPVTDSRGAVVGIATAVSIVQDGAGTSWGYVLPIRSIEEALKCREGFSALPRPFSVAPHVKAIASSTTADRAAIAYRKAIEEASRQCASALELARAFEELTASLQSSKGTLPKDRYKAFNEASLSAATTLLGRLFEFGLTGEDESVERALSTAIESDALQKWHDAVITRTFGPMSERDRLVAVAELLSEHASGLSALLTSSGRDCAALQSAVSALDSDGASNRSSVRALSKALASLIVTRANLAMVDPEIIDPDSPELPLPVRQRLRTCRAALQNCLDEWMALPADCRRVAEDLVEQLESPPDGAKRRDPPEEGRKGSALDSALSLWTQAGFSVWGGVQRGRTEGASHAFSLDFDEAPAMAWLGVRSPDGSEFSVTVKDSRGRTITEVGSIRQGDVTWSGVELLSDSKIVARFESSGVRDYQYEFVVVYRQSPLAQARLAIEAAMPGFREVGCRSLVLNPGETDEFAFDASEWSAFTLFATDVRGSDIDIEVLDAGKRRVAVDTENDSNPIVSVTEAARGEYMLRFRNAGRSLAIVDSVIYGKRR